MQKRAGQKVLVSSGSRELYAVGSYVGHGRNSKKAGIKLQDGSILILHSYEFEFAEDRFPLQEMLFGDKLRAQENMHTNLAQVKAAPDSLVDIVLDIMLDPPYHFPTRVDIDDVLSAEHAYLLQVPSILPLDDSFEKIQDAMLTAAREVSPGYSGLNLGYLALLLDQLKKKKGIPVFHDSPFGAL